MPSRIGRTGADFTPANSQHGTISCAKRPILSLFCANHSPHDARVSAAKRWTSWWVLSVVLSVAPALAHAQPAHEDADPPSSEANPVVKTDATSTDAMSTDAMSTDATSTDATSAIRGAPAPPVEITVQGEVPANAGSKLREPLRDVPSTVNTVSAKTLAERGTTDLVEALRNVAGVNPILQYGGFSYLTIRGFKDFVLVVDGVRDDRFYFVESAPTANLSDIARIDVLKGPASALYGYGGIGGVVSLTRKAPSETLSYEGGVSIGGTLTGPGILRRASGGVGGPLADTHLSYRLDMGIADDADFRGARAESAKLSGALEWRPTGVHRVRLRASYSRDRFNTDTGIPTDETGHIPAGIALNRRFNTAQDYLTSRSFDVSGAYTLQASRAVEFSARLNYTYNPCSYASSETLGLGPNDTVTRAWFFLERRWKPLYTALEVSATGKALLEHRALAGYELGLLWAQNPNADLSASDLLPVPYAKSPDPQGGYAIQRTSRLDWKQTTHSVYVHDTVTLLTPLKLAVGTRIDHWELTQTRRIIDPNTLVVQATTSQIDRSSSALTWRAGLVYQPTEWGTLYGSATTAFRPAREVPADNRQLAPEHGRQFELGVRGEFLKRHVHLNLALYDIAKRDVVVDRGAGVYDQAGKQISRGFEADLELRPLRGFTAQAGYAYTHARYASYQSPDGTDYSGRTTVNVPDHTATLWLTYRRLNGLGFGLGGRAIGKSYADPSNHVPLEPYAVLDGAVYYRFSPIELALNVNNLLGTERYFVSSINDTQLTPGQPRVVMASIRIGQ
jgi:iron complex outermembrane receptor protein